MIYKLQLPWLRGKTNSVSTRSLFILSLSKKFTRRENNAGRCRRQRPALFSLQIDYSTPLYLNVPSIYSTRAYLQLFQSHLSTTLSLSSTEIINFLFSHFNLFYFFDSLRSVSSPLSCFLVQVHICWVFTFENEGQNPTTYLYLR